MLERLQKIISAAGITSRRASEALILNGQVAVNGVVVTELGSKADPDKDTITVDGKALKINAQRLYILLNKPPGYITALKDSQNRPLVTDLLKDMPERVYPVGRLDYNTEGLLLLTNDGEWANRLMHPSHEIEKEYHVRVRGKVIDQQLKRMAEGVELEDGMTAPAVVNLVKSGEQNDWISVAIHEGRNRQVRRMCEAVSLSVVRLKRIRYGSLMLGTLRAGQFRYLTDAEVRQLADIPVDPEAAKRTRLVTGRKRTTEQDINDFIDASEEEGLVNEEESEMIRSIFSLGTTIVREVMVTRTEMACVTVDASVRELLDTIIACGHSRIPVYEDTIDNIIGLLYAKDLLKLWGANVQSLSVREIMRPPYFIPESKNLEQLLQEFKHKRIHLAIVIDEYGGTSGLITIEDLLEQIVGDIQDEYDREESLLSVNPDGSVTADGRLPVEELEEHFAIQIERDNFDSVGGLVFHLTGKIPAVGDAIEGSGLCLTILDADLRRVKKVSISRLNGASAEDMGRE